MKMRNETFWGLTTLVVMALLLAAVAFAAVAWGGEASFTRDLEALRLFDPATRPGVVRQEPAGRVDVYDGRDWRRLGWGRRAPDGGLDVFDANGRRLGAVTGDGRVLREGKR